MVNQPHAVPRPPVTLHALPDRFWSPFLIRDIASFRSIVLALFLRVRFPAFLWLAPVGCRIATATGLAQVRRQTLIR